MDYPLVSVIVLNYNGLKNLGNLLEECIRSLLNTEYPNFEVLFVDNASTDGSIEFIKEKFGHDKRLRIIRNKRNLGFAEGNNVGIRKSRGEYIAFLNNDVKVDAKWLKELVKVLKQPEIGAAQSKLLQLNNPLILDCAGGFLDYIGYAYERGRGQEATKYETLKEIFYAKGAGLIIKLEILRRIGFFDPITFLYYDETDLCWRVWLHGYKVVFVPTSIIAHAQGLTTSKLQQQRQLYFLTRNHMLTLIKNYDAKNLIKNLTAFTLIELKKILSFMLKGQMDMSISIIKALTWNITHLRYAWKRRLITQKLIRRFPDRELKKLMINPYPPFPHSLILPKSCYSKDRVT